MSNQLTIVIPLYNEESAIRHLFNALNELTPKLPKKTEVIFIDDGSSDDTVLEIQKRSLRFSKRIISFSRNFGHQAALFAGLKEADGEFVITMDGDLQHPPSLIPSLLSLHKEGFDVVLTQRIDTQRVSIFKRVTSAVFYALINTLSSTHIPINGSDFRSMSRRAVEALLSMPENRKFLRGMVYWIGFKTVIVPFTVSPRVAGSSKYSVGKMLRLALEGITSFSVTPLYLSGITSIVIFMFTLLYIVYVLYARFFTGKVVEGWTSVMLVVLILGGLVTLFLGLIGLYLASIYEEIKKRPLFIKK